MVVYRAKARAYTRTTPDTQPHNHDATSCFIAYKGTLAQIESPHAYTNLTCGVGSAQSRRHPQRHLGEATSDAPQYPTDARLHPRV
eukprot:1297309-Pyramimonas_sp.AAC.3